MHSHQCCLLCHTFLGHEIKTRVWYQFQFKTESVQPTINDTVVHSAHWLWTYYRDGRRVTFGETGRGKARISSFILSSSLLLQCITRFEIQLFTKLPIYLIYLSCVILICYNASLGLTFLFKYQLFTFCVNIEIGTNLICHLFGCCYVYGGLTLEHHQGRTNLNGKDFVVLYFIFWFEWEYFLTFNRWKWSRKLHPTEPRRSYMVDKSEYKSEYIVDKSKYVYLNCYLQAPAATRKLYWDPSLVFLKLEVEWNVNPISIPGTCIPHICHFFSTGTIFG